MRCACLQIGTTSCCLGTCTKGTDPTPPIPECAWIWGRGSSLPRTGGKRRKQTRKRLQGRKKPAGMSFLLPGPKSSLDFHSRRGVLYKTNEHNKLSTGKNGGWHTILTPHHPHALETSISSSHTNIISKVPPEDWQSSKLALPSPASPGQTRAH